MAPTDVTLILQQVCDGDESVVDRLLPLVYEELRRIAQAHLSSERSDHTLQAAALVHEAYLRLVDQTGVAWQTSPFGDLEIQGGEEYLLSGKMFWWRHGRHLGSGSGLMIWSLDSLIG